eukprot:403379_1
MSSTNEKVIDTLHYKPPSALKINVPQYATTIEPNDNNNNNKTQPKTTTHLTIPSNSGQISSHLSELFNLTSPTSLKLNTSISSAIINNKSPKSPFIIPTNIYPYTNSPYPSSQSSAIPDFSSPTPIDNKLNSLKILSTPFTNPTKSKSKNYINYIQQANRNYNYLSDSDYDYDNDIHNCINNNILQTDIQL